MDAAAGEGRAGRLTREARRARNDDPLGFAAWSSETDVATRSSIKRQHPTPSPSASMSRSAFRRTRHWIALAAVLYLADCIFLGYTPENAFLTSRVEFNNARWEDLNGMVIPVGTSVPLDACINDGGSGDMYFFVHDCARRHPWLFTGESSGKGAVFWDKRTLTAVRTGPFTFTVRSMGHGVRFSGEVVAVPDIMLTTADTTLRVGEELEVAWRLSVAANEPTPLVKVQVHSPHRDGSVWWQEISGASPGAVHIRALKPGYTCLGFSAYTNTAWLRVVVTDSSGMTSVAGTSTAANGPRCGAASQLSPTRSDTPSVARSAQFATVLADSITAQGAAMAFAYQRCMAHAIQRGSATPGYTPHRDSGACSDSVQSLGPAWQVSLSDADLYTADFRYFFGEGAAARTVTASGRDLTVTVYDQREMYGHVVKGPESKLQGDELAMVRSAAACAQLYEREAGRTAPSFDSLRAFALTRWSRQSAASAPLDGCDYAKLTGFAPGTSDRDALVHESARFTLRYLPHGAHATIEVRPKRWGKTGIVSYRYEGASLLRRTLEDRSPHAADERFDAKTGSWSRARG